MNFKPKGSVVTKVVGVRGGGVSGKCKKASASSEKLRKVLRLGIVAIERKRENSS